MLTPQIVGLVVLAPGLIMLGFASLSLLGLSYGRAPAGCTPEESLVRAAIDVNFGLYPLGFGVAIQVYALVHPQPLTNITAGIIIAATGAFCAAHYGFIRKRLVAVRLAIQAKRRSAGA